MPKKNLGYYLGRIVAFYRGNFHNYGLWGVIRLSTALAMTALKPLVIRLGPRTCHCPCCGWRGSRFLPFLATGYVGFDALCPVCESSPRHRAHRVFYERDLGFSRREGRLLYFAPEHNLHYFRENPRLDVKTSNYPDGEADFHLDILDMPFGEEWDYIVCHRVIEHLRDDKAGMQAFHRILKPGGFAIVSVPISDFEKSIEYGAPNPLENEHYYSYGTDFATRIPDVFRVDEYRFSTSFTPEEHREFGLIEDFIFVLHKPAVAGDAAAA